MSLENPRIKILRVNSIQDNTNILPDGQPLYDKTSKKIYVGDGQTQIKDLKSNYDLANVSDYANNVKITPLDSGDDKVNFQIGYKTYNKTINNVDYSNSSNIALKKKLYSTKTARLKGIRLASKQFYITNELAKYVWTDGTDYYYSKGTTHYKLDKLTSTWNKIFWSISEFDGDNVWSDNINIYYSYGNKQYILNSNKSWSTKRWYLGSTSTAFYPTGKSIWSDGTAFYMYNSGTQVKLTDASSGLWQNTTEYNLSSFRFFDLWTDGNDIYYSSSYKLNKESHRWIYVNDWKGLTSFRGIYIWNDLNGNTYYSYRTSNYKLDKENHTWNKIFWNIDYVYGNHIWNDKVNTYYCWNNEYYVLNKETNIWEKKNWVGLPDYVPYNSSSLGPIVYPIWSDGKYLYYNDNDQLTTSVYDEVNYKYDDENSAWIHKHLPKIYGFNSSKIWNDDENTYYSDGGTQYKLSKSKDSWINVDWSFSDGGDYPRYKVADPQPTADNYVSRDYYIYTNNSYSHGGVYNNSYTYYIRSGTTLTNFLNSSNIWTDGNNIYLSYCTFDSDNNLTNSYQYKLSKDEIQFGSSTFYGLTNFYGKDVWSDGENTYYSNGTNQYKLSSSTWTSKSWSGLTNFYGKNVWSDGVNTYYSNFSDQYILNKNTNTWTKKTWTGLTSFYGEDVWSDKNNIYYSRSSNQYILDKNTNTWNQITWNGLSYFDGEDVWSYNNNIYMSSSNYHFILNKGTKTWNRIYWNGYNDFYGSEIWFYKNNVYSNEYVLDYDAQTWTNKAWYIQNTGDYWNITPISISGSNIWTYKNKLYYSSGTTQYDLRDTTQWYKITWQKVNSVTIDENGNISYSPNGNFEDLEGKYIWSDGVNTYYSKDDKQFYLDKAVNKWAPKSWSGLTNFYGNRIWKYKDNFYYSNDNYLINYVLDRDTSTWITLTNYIYKYNYDFRSIWSDMKSAYLINNEIKDQINIR